MNEVKAIAQQVARLLRKSGLETYDQTKHVFREVRRELDLSPPKRSSRGGARHLSAEEIRAFLQVAHRRDAALGLMLKTLYKSAVRVDEFTSLEAYDLRYERRRLVVRSRKRDTDREVILSPQLAQLLGLHLGDRRSGPLFCSRRGRAYSNRRIQQLVDEVADAAEITKRVTPQVLRLTRAALLTEGGLPREQLELFLGKKKVYTTEVQQPGAQALNVEAFDRADRGHEAHLP